MKAMKNKIGKYIVILGCLCIVAAAVITFYNMYDDARASYAIAEENEKLTKLVLSPHVLKQRLDERSPQNSDTPADTAAPSEEPFVYREMPTLNIDGVDYVAILSIPSLGLEFSVRNEWSYPELKKSPCRYTGSAYMNDLVICAHNFSSHFGRLKELEPGAEVLLVDMKGALFTYSVETVEQLAPFETVRMTDSEYDLTLFTCTIGGRNRVTVRCRLVDMAEPIDEITEEP